MYAIHQLAEFPALTLSKACKIANEYKRFYEEIGYENVLFSIVETRLDIPFRVIISGRRKDVL